MTVLLAALLLASAGPDSPLEESVDRLFAEACRLHGEERFEDAADLFEEAARSGESAQSGAAFHNMGVCLFEMGRHSEALWAFFCAEKRLPRDKQVRSKIGMTCERLGTFSRMGDERRHFADAFRSATGAVATEEYLAGAALAASFFLLLAGLFLLRGRGLSWRFLSLLAPAAVLLGLAFCVRDGPRGAVGVAVQQGGFVYDERSEEGEAVFSLGEGEVVAVTERPGDDGWLLVRSVDGSQGWTRSVREVR